MARFSFVAERSKTHRKATGRRPQVGRFVEDPPTAEGGNAGWHGACPYTGRLRRIGASLQSGDERTSQEHFQQFTMVTWHDNVMIANRLLQEIVRLALVRKLNDLLCTTEVGLRLIAYEGTLSYEVTRKVA